MMLFVALALLASLALADVDSLHCRMVDWMDAEGTRCPYGPEDESFCYHGTCAWDLTMGDSFLVWVTGEDSIIFIDVLSSESIVIDTCLSYDWGTGEASGVAVGESTYYVTGGPFIISLIFEGDSIVGGDYIYEGFARFHYAVIEDSFLYTVNFNGGIIYCINIANQESIFVHRTFVGPASTGGNGLEVLDGFSFVSSSGTTIIDDGFDYYYRPYWWIGRIDIVNSPTPESDTVCYYYNRQFGDIASNDSLVFYVNTELSDCSEETDWTWNIGETHLGVWENDYSYTWDSLCGEVCFGIDIITDELLAVGFEHGFSILNYSNLDSIYEVAYYRESDSQLCFTHFALKDSLLYTMAHPKTDTCRLYMFELDDCVISGQCEIEQIPEEFRFWNYPNPFNSSCRLCFAGIGAHGRAPLRVDIFDITGRLVDNIHVGRGNRAPTEIIWRPENLPSGLYLARITVGEESYTAKIVYLA